MDKVYKVVTRYRGGLISSGVYGRAMVWYRPLRRARAPLEFEKAGYGLLAFSCLKDAERWVGSGMEIWKAIGIGRMPLPPYLLCDIVSEDGIEAARRWGEAGEWPAGTRMYRRVILLRRVG